MDKYALAKAVTALIAVISEDPNDYPDAASHRQVMDRIKTVQEIINPTEPEWFTEVKDLYSPSEMANDMIEGFDMGTLCCYAQGHLEESLNNPEAYLDTLQNGWIGKFCELDTNNGEPYEDELLDELSEHTGRPVEQYREDSNLVVLDYLRKEAKP